MDNKNKQNEYAIEVNDIDKSFMLSHSSVGSIKDFFINPAKYFKGKQEKFEAISDIDFKVKKGEFLGIIGRNGSGKSTLLKLIAGIYTPDKGSIKVNGSLVPFLELGVGFNPELSARENIFLNGTILGMSKKFLEKKFDEIVHFAELEKFVDTEVKKFSSGMLVRLAFSIAMQTEADIYLLDEILSVGDANFRMKSQLKFAELIEKKKTIILISHSMDEIQKYCSRVIYLEKGKIKASGKPSKVVDLYNQDNIEKTEQYLTEENKFNNDSKTTKESTGPKLNKIVTITKVETFNNQLEPKRIFVTGDTLIVRVHFEAHQEIPNPSWGIAMYKNTDQLIYSSSTTRKGLIYEKLSQGKDYVDFVFEKLVLLDGNYSISTAVGSNKWGLLAQNEKSNDFIMNKGTSQDSGIVKLEPTVKINKKIKLVDQNNDSN